MEIFSSYNVIIEAAIVVILSFWFNSIAKKTNIPAVLMLITLGILIKIGLGFLIPTIPRLYVIT
ncbi:hypothetical protein NYZ99_02860 [Maribacter litopenaei]|uniref:Sodium/hydrogen exchanger family protein n=1 Tax=Maribacter litopenaei TaxID=2976127 RepID=A0ABY5YC66_9FLAO|nr:hypothetical protein [Maribacter litopenaei]UWX55486.1 hypothetical protein NYZ99_02860 [Maribacter litopenaei]